jgi:phage tail-like protein
MRGTVTGLGTPYPLHTLLPAVYQEDNFTPRFTAAIDEVIAPIVSSLDCLAAYLDPKLAPVDFLDWMSTWFSEVLDENWPPGRRRQFVADAVEMFRIRGTLAGLRKELELGSGGRVEIAESGGVSWSRKPNAELPGEDVPRLAVRVLVDDPDAVDRAALEALIAAAKPAYIVHRLEVLAHDRLP